MGLILVLVSREIFNLGAVIQAPIPTADGGGPFDEGPTDRFDMGVRDATSRL